MSETLPPGPPEPLSGLDRLRVLAVAVPFAGLAWMVLMVLAVMQLGQGIGALFSLIGGQDATARWWVQDLGMSLIAIGAVVGQVLGTRGLAALLSAPEKRAATARFALICAVLLVPVPAAVGALLDRCDEVRSEATPA